MGETSKSKKGERLNWEQACRILGCGKTHFYHLVNSGALPAYRSGGKRGLWVWEKDCRELIVPVSQYIND